MGLFTGLITFYILYGVLSTTTTSAVYVAHLNWIFVLQLMYYASSLSGVLYPGAGWMDPQFGEGKPQAFGFPVLMVVAGVGWGMERARAMV